MHSRNHEQAINRCPVLTIIVSSFAEEVGQEIPSYYVTDKNNSRAEDESPVVTEKESDTETTDLYKILQRANLLSYYETFIDIGADDITQLFDTCGEDFEEAIEASGMASKPLHVKRLERALNDWQHELGKHTRYYRKIRQMWRNHKSVHNLSRQDSWRGTCSCNVHKSP